MVSRLYIVAKCATQLLNTFLYSQNNRTSEQQLVAKHCEAALASLVKPIPRNYQFTAKPKR